MTIAEKFRLDGQVALITGGGGGLGRAMAKAFAEMGADVALTARSQKRLEAAASDVRALGRRAAVIPADLTDPAEPRRIVETAVAELGSINTLINNAGGVARPDIKVDTLIDMPDADWDDMIALNLSSAFRMTKAAVPRMANGGSVLFISSIKAFRPEGAAGYATAKAALNQLALALSQELAPRIRVNAVAPGPIATYGFRRANNIEPGADTAAIAEDWGVPLRRVGFEDDVAAAAIYLASAAGSWVTGQTLVVAGGL